MLFGPGLGRASVMMQKALYCRAVGNDDKALSRQEASTLAVEKGRMEKGRAV